MTCCSPERQGGAEVVGEEPCSPLALRGRGGRVACSGPERPRRSCFLFISSATCLLLQPDQLLPASLYWTWSWIRPLHAQVREHSSRALLAPSPSAPPPLAADTAHPGCTPCTVRPSPTRTSAPWAGTWVSAAGPGPQKASVHCRGRRGSLHSDLPPQGHRRLIKPEET